MKTTITEKTQEELVSNGWRIIAKVPANSSREELNKIAAGMSHTLVIFTYQSDGQTENILVWTRESDAMLASKIVRHSLFKTFTTFVAHGLATVFFFWADWRIGTGWSLLVLGSLNFTAAKQAFEEGRKSVRGGEK